MERARKRLFPRVHSDVVHQLVLGFERLPLPRTVLPVAHVLRVLWSSDVLHCHMGDKFIHCAESSGAGQLTHPLLAVDPLTYQLMFLILFRASDVGVAPPTLNRHIQRLVQPQELGDELLVVSPRADGLAIGMGPGKQVSW